MIDHHLSEDAAELLASEEKRHPVVKQIRAALEKAGVLLANLPPGSFEELDVQTMIGLCRNLLGGRYQIITPLEIARVHEALRRDGEMMTEMEKKRRHRSRKPDLEQIKKVKAYKDDGHTWPETDKKFRYEPDGARQLINRAKKKGWI